MDQLPAGASVAVSGGDGVTYYWPSGRIRIDGNIALQGGGLPTARIALSQPRSGGADERPCDHCFLPRRKQQARNGAVPFRRRARWFDRAAVGCTDGRAGAGRFRARIQAPDRRELRWTARFRLRPALPRGAVSPASRWAAFDLRPARLPVCPIGPAIAYRGKGGVAVSTKGCVGPGPFVEYIKEDSFLRFEKLYGVHIINHCQGKLASAVIRQGTPIANCPVRRERLD